MNLTRKQVRILNWRLYVRAASGTASLVMLALWPTWSNIVICLSLIWYGQVIASCFTGNQEMIESDAMIIVVLTLAVGATTWMALVIEGNDALQVQALVAAVVPVALLVFGGIYLLFDAIIPER